MIPDEKTCWDGGEHVWDASGVWCDKCGVFWPDGTGPMFIPTCHAEYVKELARENEDVCGLCGHPGADKIPHSNYWPGEQRPGTELVHATCEAAETTRAHAALSPQEREAALRQIRGG